MTDAVPMKKNLCSAVFEGSRTLALTVFKKSSKMWLQKQWKESNMMQSTKK